MASFSEAVVPSFTIPMRSKWAISHYSSGFLDSSPRDGKGASRGALIGRIAHAWNVLTVGVCTEKVRIDDSSLQSWAPLAKTENRLMQNNNGLLALC